MLGILIFWVQVEFFFQSFNEFFAECKIVGNLNNVVDSCCVVAFLVYLFVYRFINIIYLFILLLLRQRLIRPKPTIRDRCFLQVLFYNPVTPLVIVLHHFFFIYFENGKAYAVKNLLSFDEEDVPDSEREFQRHVAAEESHEPLSGIERRHEVLLF
jgi:hypothetical protein